MNFNKKRFGAGMLTAILASAAIATTTNAVNADTSVGTPEEQADITNWIANTPQQVSNNMAMQHIDVNNLNGVRYVIQWGDTLSSISAATGISVPKLCYDNHIMNANFIYAGNVLILNRNGYVPTDFQPNINPYVVAQTKVTINNGPQVVNIKVQPKAISQYYDNSTNTDNSDNSTNTTNIYKAPSDSSHSTSDNKDADDKDSSSSSSDKSSAISAEDIATGLDKANDNDKLSFQATDDDSDVKDADEVNIDSDEIKKDAKKDDYSDILDKINDALDKDNDKDVTVYIEEDGDEIHIYVSHDKDSDSDKDSNSDEDKQSSDKDDEDSQDKATDSDEDSQSSDKDSNDEDSQNDDNQNSNQTDSNDQSTDEDDD